VLTYFLALGWAISLARSRFTVLFGMGRGGTETLWTPDGNWGDFWGDVGGVEEVWGREGERVVACSRPGGGYKVIGSSRTGN
jgi:hypothetical protein